MANQGSARQNRAGDQSVSIHRSRSGREMSRWDAGSYGPFSWMRGERRHDHEEERDGVFRSERSYGSFCRVVPLPQGAIADSAKATFNNGVLEVVVQAPSFDVRRGRRVEIKEGTSEQKSNQQNPKT
jgi:HSP20 family protein